MAEHWNAGVAEARGAYVKVLCDDDWLIEGAVAREVAALENDKSLVACASARLEIETNGRITPKRFRDFPVILPKARLFAHMLREENILGPPSGVTFRKSCFHGFPPAYAYAADWAAWIEMGALGRTAFLPQPGVNFRLHAGNLTQRYVADGTDFREVMALRRECLDRLLGWERAKGAAYYKAIFLYRLARRLARLLRGGRLRGAWELATSPGSAGSARG
jgi:hypothetical protein